MRHFVMAGLLALASPFMAFADDNPVVVELFTSQGCSSCPPADALLHELTERDDVIALALHVDYWDYIGWKDEFARPEFTHRQKLYARAAGQRMIYTPQMIVGGTSSVVGSRPMQLAELIAQNKSVPRPIDVDLERKGGVVAISMQAGAAPDGTLHVMLVRYIPSRTVDIPRGENAGLSITYSNIVSSWTEIGEWSEGTSWQATAEAPGDEPVVVIVQQPGPGPIVASAVLR